MANVELTSTSTPPTPPPLPAIVVTFTYRWEDLHEAMQPKNRARKKPPSGPLHRLFMVITWIAVVGWIALLEYLAKPTPAQRSQLPASNLWIVLGPSYAIAIYFGALAIFGSVVLRLSRSRSSKQRNVVSVLLMGAVIGTGIWTFLALHILDNPPWPLDLHVTASEALWLALAPWSVLLLFVLLRFVGLAGRAARQRWRQFPGYQRQKTVHLDNERLTISDDVTSQQLRWRFFVDGWETPNVLVLLDENIQRYFLPKRAFGSPNELDRARALLNQLIPNAQFVAPATGFPIAMIR